MFKIFFYVSLISLTTLTAQASLYYAFRNSLNPSKLNNRTLASVHDNSPTASPKTAENVMSKAKQRYSECLASEIEIQKLVDLASGIKGEEKVLSDLSTIYNKLLTDAFATQLAKAKAGKKSADNDDVRVNFEKAFVNYLQKSVPAKDFKNHMARMPIKLDESMDQACDIQALAPDALATIATDFGSELGDKMFSSKSEMVDFYKAYLTKIAAKVQKGEIARNDLRLWFFENGNVENQLFKHVQLSGNEYAEVSNALSMAEKDVFAQIDAKQTPFPSAKLQKYILDRSNPITSKYLAEFEKATPKRP